MEEKVSLGLAGTACLQATPRQNLSAQFVGQSGAFQSIVETIDMVALRKSSVIITGETGTGKEMVARQIHAGSNRAKKALYL